MFKINGRNISTSEKPYIIAELSANHNGSLEQAMMAIQSAKDCGVDAIKIQTYTPDTMTLDCDKSDFIVQDGLWKGYKLYDLYSEAHTPLEWHAELFRFSRELGITIFSTPFDESAVDFLESLNTPAYKISSFELTDLPLISYVAKKGKPIFLSTGMATEQEISEALETIYDNNNNSVLLFHCVSNYPTPIADINLKKILNLRKKFDISIGLSDHTMGNTAAISAIALGACAIEKHFTISRNLKGPDSEFSAEPNELKALVRESNDAWFALGSEDFVRPASEGKSLNFRRSLYFASNLKAGETIKFNDIRRIRPGFGLKPKFLDTIIGRKVLENVELGDAVTWQVISND